MLPIATLVFEGDPKAGLEGSGFNTFTDSDDDNVTIYQQRTLIRYILYCLKIFQGEKNIERKHKPVV